MRYKDILKCLKDWDCSAGCQLQKENDLTDDCLNCRKDYERIFGRSSIACIKARYTSDMFINIIIKAGL